ncbi:MAG: OmpH family outer membrane protein [Planctomycetes bacterium]|nr:OmpH family outer membrane protein [Planctomycetota bacterium]
MKTFRNRINLSTALLLAALAGVIGYSSNANRPAMAPPSVVATVDFTVVFDGLTERSDVDARMTEIAAELDEKAGIQREAIELLIEDLQLYAPGSPQYEETERKIARQTYELRAFREFSIRKLELKKAQALRQLYANIKSAASGLASEQGYDLVFVNDAMVEVPAAATENETWTHIAARRMLYANPMLDVTEELVERMNNAFAHGG